MDDKTYVPTPVNPETGVVYQFEPKQVTMAYSSASGDLWTMSAFAETPALQAAQLTESRRASTLAM